MQRQSMQRQSIQLQCGNKVLDLSRPAIMGILNATPDSFSDGGDCYQGGRLALDLALKKADAMLAAGADIIDIGGESTRPGAEAITVSEELDRVVPLVEAIARSCDTIISVDTSSPEVMREAAAVGAGLINDVRALRRPGALQAAAATRLPVCLMHMQGEPGNMQSNPQYADVVEDVKDFLLARIHDCASAGLPRERIIVDPGFGFGKTLQHNLLLLNQLPELVAMGLPVLAGLSRKSMIGKLLGRECIEADQRLAGSLALAKLALDAGATILRVHDVAETVDTIKIYAAVSACVE